MVVLENIDFFFDYIVLVGHVFHIVLWVNLPSPPPNPYMSVEITLSKPLVPNKHYTYKGYAGSE